VESLPPKVGVADFQILVLIEISKLECGVRKSPGVETLLAPAKALGVEVGTLLTPPVARQTVGHGRTHKPTVDRPKRPNVGPGRRSNTMTEGDFLTASVL